MIILDKMLKRPAAGSDAPAVQGLELWGEPGSSSLSRTLDISTILLFLRRNALWIVATTLIVSLLCVVAVKIAFNQYSATATVLFDPRNAMVTGTQEVLPDIGPDSIAIESLVQVAKSDGFLTALAEQEGLSSDPEFAGGVVAPVDQKAAALDKLRSRLTIARRGATYVVDVSVKSGDPQKSARLANAAAQMMVDSESKLRSGSNRRAVDFIDSRLAQLRERVSSADAAIAKLKTELKITDAGQGEVLQERRVAELNQQLALATAHTGETRAVVDQLRDASLSAATALPASIQSSVLTSLREDYARLSRQAAERESVLGARHPDVIAANAQLNDMRRQIGAEKDRLIASAKADYLEARRREALVADELHKAQANSGAIDQDSVQLRDLERSAKSDQAVYEQLLNRQKELSEISGLTSEDVRIASAAIAPTRTNMPRLPLVLVASGIVGLFAGLGSAFVREAMRRSLVTPLQAQRVLGVDASAILPTFPQAPYRDGRSPEAETARWFDELCASERVRDAARGGVILVTSALGGEGKSTVAANVAASLARGGSEVLLIQLGDREAGRSQRRNGLIDVLSEKYPLDKAMLWYGDGRPSVMPLGGGAIDDAQIAALLSGAPLRRLVRRLRRQFDTLVIDGPSISTSPAIRSLATLAGSTLMTVEWNKTDAALVANAIEGLDLRRVALIFNRVDLARYGRFTPARGDASLAAA
jgi:succinoglycan biosynthesis transport protein ExoP